MSWDNETPDPRCACGKRAEPASERCYQCNHEGPPLSVNALAFRCFYCRRAFAEEKLYECGVCGQARICRYCLGTAHRRDCREPLAPSDPLFRDGWKGAE